MEFLPFSDLGKWTRSQKEDKPGTFTGTVKDAVRVLGDMASALAYLSKQRILHNDVKPDNIIYDGGGPRGAVLVDFGLATHCGHRTQGGSCWYIPPECLDDMFREPPSDVFALGVTMLFLLGQMPLPEDSWPDWDIDNISRNTADAMDMKAWLEHLDVLAADMGDSVASDTVRDTLLDVPEDRVSAEEIVRRLNEAGMLPGTSGGEGS